MRKNCVAKGCKSSEEDSRNVSLFKFPHHDATLLERWERAVDRPGWRPRPESQLCSDHFAAESFVPGPDRPRALRPDAVPRPAPAALQETEVTDADYQQLVSYDELEEMNDEDMFSESSGLEEYCRVCATRGFGKLYPIFGRQSEEWRVLEKISSCLPITVSHTDKISLHICAGCLRKLDASYDLVVTALDSDASFQERFPPDWWNPAQVSFADCDSDEDGSEPELCRVKQELVAVKEEEEEEDDMGGRGAGSVQIDGPATCDICLRTFDDMEVFDEHVLSEHRPGQRWPCPLCDLGFDDAGALLAHRAGAHADEMAACRACSVGVGFCCEPCDAWFPTAAETRDHCLAHGALGPGRLEPAASAPGDMTCLTCNKSFSNEAIFRKHRNLHDPRCWDQFRCKVCQRPCRDAEALRSHAALHTGNKPHMCDMCGRTYNRYANMLKHRKQHKPSAQWKHRCQPCDSTFEHMRDLSAHMQSVHGLSQTGADGVKKKPAVKWVCRFCGKVISTKLSLQDHERIHTGAKPFVCEWCGREFRSRPNLLQHHLTHTGDRRHACGICGKRFSRKSFITQHMRVHTGEKPFVCDICGHRFTQAGDMRRHRKRHAEAREEVALVLQLDPLQ
ncbi:zinc finger protein 16-like [Bacillus rossius redtenbacheri]|uniref:zinc finger protein 16-like n=1 Tax=Bacillus rossius redtenbacheri TaxID=93214 RepID=UPI002FDD778B